jgi:hypothetical protein
VFTVEPAGYYGGDEELGSVTAESFRTGHQLYGFKSLRVGTGVGHREEEWAVMLELEVFVLELLAIDGFASSALVNGSVEIFMAVYGSYNLRYHG